MTFRHEKQNYVLSTGEFSKLANLGKMRTDHVKLLLEGNMIIENAKIHHMKPEFSLLQCAGRFYSILNITSMNPLIHIYQYQYLYFLFIGTEVDILLMKAVDKKFTIANRSTQPLYISSNLAPDKLISVYNCFLQYKVCVSTVCLL